MKYIKVSFEIRYSFQTVHNDVFNGQSRESVPRARLERRELQRFNVSMRQLTNSPLGLCSPSSPLSLLIYDAAQLIIC